MHLTSKQAEWLISKGVVVIPSDYGHKIIPPVADISMFNPACREKAPALPGWVLNATFTNRIECTSGQIDAIKALGELIRNTSVEFFDSPWMYGIDLIAFDVALGESTDYEIEVCRNWDFRPDQSLSEIVTGDLNQPGFAELAMDAGGWVTNEGWVPMLHWLLGRYTAESVLPQVFQEARV